MSNNFPDIISLVREKTSIIAEERYVEIRKVIDGAIKRCVDKYFWFIANDVFGRTSKPDLVGFEHVTWKPLSNRYLYQNPKKKNNLFWVSGSDPTDSLQTYFRSITKGSDYFPENDIVFKKDKGIVRRRKGPYAGQVFMKGEISVELGFFKTKRNPIMEHDRFGNEARGGVTKKLYANENEKKRPFFRPTMIYFAKQLIPRAIEVDLRKHANYRSKFIPREEI